MFLVGRDYTLEKNKIKVEADHFKDILMEEFSDDDHIRKVVMGMSIVSFRMNFLNFGKKQVWWVIADPSF